MSNDLILWGATGQSKVLREITDAAGLRLVAVFDNDTTVRSPFHDLPVRYGREGFLDWRRSHSGRAMFAVAIGGQHGRVRLALQDWLADQDLAVVNVVHSRSYVSLEATLGSGCQVLAGAIIGVEAVLGRGCIVNTGASVDHECVLHDGVHVGPGATLAGEVKVGTGAFIGAGAVVLPRVRIGSDVIVGAGAVVIDHVPDRATVVGNPARILRVAEPSDTPGVFACQPGQEA